MNNQHILFFVKTKNDYKIIYERSGRYYLEVESTGIAKRISKEEVDKLSRSKNKIDAYVDKPKDE